MDVTVHAWIFRLLTGTIENLDVSLNKLSVLSRVFILPKDPSVVPPFDKHAPYPEDETMRRIGASDDSLKRRRRSNVFEP